MLAISSPPATAHLPTAAINMEAAWAALLRRTKLFFFLDYEGIRQLLEENKVATVPNCPAVCTPTATNPVTRQAIINTLAIYPKPDPGTASGLLGYTATYGNQIVHED